MPLGKVVGCVTHVQQWFGVACVMRLFCHQAANVCMLLSWMLLSQGYAPISIRLVEAALKGGWGPVAEVLSMLPGGQFDSLQVRTGCAIPVTSRAALAVAL
jgi:hypothetical protein